MSGPFSVDPWDAAKNYYERRMMNLVARVMKKCGVTQVDLSDVDLMADDELVMDRGDSFLRIKGNFQLKEPR